MKVGILATLYVEPRTSRCSFDPKSRAKVWNKTFVPFITLVLLAPLNFVPVRANAQVSGGTLSGTVTNESGAPIPNVQVSLSDVASDVTRAATTDVAGFYTVPNLPPGSYEMTVSALGFTTQVWTGITITVAAKTLSRWSE
jgi:hypothetical protein